MKTLKAWAARDKGLEHVFGEFCRELRQLDGRRDYPVHSMYWQNAIGAERVLTGYLSAMMWADKITFATLAKIQKEKADALYRGKVPEVTL